MLTRLACAAAAVLLLSGCVGDEAEPSRALVTGSPTDSPESPPADNATRLVSAEQTADGVWSVSVPTDADSMLVVAHGTDLTDVVTMHDVVAPDGASLADSLLFEDNVGEYSLLLPRWQEEALVAGTWRFELSSPGGVQRVDVVFTTDTTGKRAIDATFWVVSDHPDVSSGRRQALADAFRATGDAAFGPHDLQVGDLRFLDAADDVRAAHAQLPLPSSGDDVALRELCEAMDAAVGDRTSLHVAIVDAIIDDEALDAQTEGNAAGIPGAAGILGASTSCVVIIVDGDRPLLEMSDVVWHEAGHLLGLPHTTEFSGDAFDFFLDTAECDVDVFDRDGDEFLDADECRSADGDNLMFHDGDGVTLSGEQAWLLRHHPLFHPVP